MSSAATPTAPAVEITFDVRDPASHLVRVTQRFPATDDAVRTFRMAAWVPGSYKIRDFGRHVQDAEAWVDGKRRKAEQTGKDAWTVSGVAGKDVELRFDAYCRELTVDTSHVTSDHAHIFPATTTLYDEASRRLPHKVTVRKPRGWTLWSGLETADFDGTLAVPEDYDHLIDCPIEAGPKSSYHEASFMVRRKPHRIVFWMPPEGMDAEAITADVKAVVSATADLFGGLPYAHYTFLGHVAMEHGGGLEHRNSTVLGLDPLQLVADEKKNERFLPLVAHEFFHTWNVKRILPEAFQPYDLQVEVYTDLLWLFEGFTTYYELPLLARAGVLDDKAIGTVAAEMLKFYEMALGRKRRSVSECSRLTWSLLYQPHEHNVNRNVSYYTKGLFVGLCLDAHLRKQGVKDGLDEVMRYLWAHHGPGKAGVPEDGMAGIIEAATGVDCGRLLRSWTHGTTELPIDAAFRYLGWQVTREHSDKDKRFGLGVQFKPSSAVIERIPEDGPAFKVLQPDDEIVAVEGYRWKGDRFATLAATKQAGDEVAVTVFREGRLRTFDVPLREKEKDKITVAPLKGDAAATRRRKAWSSGPA